MWFPRIRRLEMQKKKIPIKVRSALILFRRA
jgi:hypothetical protein